MATRQAKTSPDHLKEYLTLMQGLRPLTPQQEATCLSLLRAGDPMALRHLAESYLPRVLSWVAPMRGRGMSFDQLIAAGNLALLQALESAPDGVELEAFVRDRLLAALDTRLGLEG